MMYSLDLDDGKSQNQIMKWNNKRNGKGGKRYYKD